MGHDSSLARPRESVLTHPVEAYFVGVPNGTRGVADKAEGAAARNLEMLPQSGSGPKEARVRAARSALLPVAFMRETTSGRERGCHCDTALTPALSTDSRV